MSVFIVILLLYSCQHFCTALIDKYCSKLDNNTVSQMNLTNPSDVIADQLWEKFSKTPTSGYSSFTVTIGFSLLAACKLEMHRLTSLSSQVFYSKGIYNSFGTLIDHSSYKKHLPVITNFTTSHDFDIDNLPSNTWFVFGLTCNLTFENGTSVSYSTDYKHLKTPGVSTSAPSLKAYVTHHQYGFVYSSRWVTLVWSPLNVWDIRSERSYQAACVEYLHKCEKECNESFENCKTCTQTNKIFAWQEQHKVEWQKTSTIIPANGIFAPIAQGVQGIVCSIHGVHDINEGPWANPVHVDLQIKNPAPKLLVNGKIGMASVVATVIVEATHMGFYIPHKRPYNFFTAPKLAYGTDYECCIAGSLEPWVILWESETKPKDFCRNWIQKAFYSIRACDDDSQRNCMYLDDKITKTKGKSQLIFDGTEKPLEKIVCNPFTDVVAFTEKDEEDGMSYNLYIYHGTRNEMKKFYKKSSCLQKTGGLVSGAIAIDWKSDGSILVLGKTSQLWTVSHTCESRFVGEIPLKQFNKIQQITSDWQNFYWLTSDNKIRFKSRLGTDTGVEEMTNFVHEKDGKSLENTMFSEILDITAASPEMRRLLEADQYLPTISSLKIIMTSEETAKVTATIEWSSKLKSLQPPLELTIWYKIFVPNDTTGCSGLGKCTAISTTEASRDEVISLTIPNLKKDVRYYVEVKGSTGGDEWRYIPREISKSGTFLSKYIPPTNPFPAPVNKNLAAVASVSVILLLLLLAILIAGVYWYVTRVKPFRHLCRISKSQITLRRKLGGGFFAEVHHGYLLKSKDQQIQVAVKILKESADPEAKKSFLEEAIILGHIMHRNIVRIQGICLSSKPNMIILDFVNGGSLSSYLQVYHVANTVMFLIAIDICQACCFLIKKGYIHRDIRAANVLIQLRGKDNRFKSAVLADFGLAKDRGSQAEPYTTDQPQFPLRHSAPECFEGHFSHASDVYMFGILLWEIFSFGDTPFKDVPIQELEFKLRYDNLTLSQPENCPDQVYGMMLDCWKKDAEKRPSFKKIQEYLEVAKHQFSEKGKRAAPLGITFSECQPLIPAMVNAESYMVSIDPGAVALTDAYTPQEIDQDGNIYPLDAGKLGQRH